MGPEILEQTEMSSEQEQSIEQRFNEMVLKLRTERNWTERKAKRFLNAMSRRRIKKVTKPKCLKVVRQICKNFASF